MDLDLNEKVAVVTGESKGKRLVIVQTLAAQGASVVANADDQGWIPNLWEEDNDYRILKPIDS